MKKLSFLFISLLTAFAFAGCTDGLDNVEYNPSNGVVLSAPVSGTATSSSLTVTSTMTGNVGVVLKKRFLLQCERTESYHQGQCGGC